MAFSFTFITGNASKAEEVAMHCDFSVLHKKVDLMEIQSLDLTEVVTKKAQEGYKLLKTPVLVEDTSLTFHALGKLPGPFIKWFLVSLGNSGLCKLLNSYKDRGATAMVKFAFYDGEVLKIFDGYLDGKIVKKPKGEKGFGWDPIFVPNGYTKTWGQMSPEEKSKTSMRKVALKKLERYLKSVYVIS